MRTWWHISPCLSTLFCKKNPPRPAFTGQGFIFFTLAARTSDKMMLSIASITNMAVTTSVLRFGLFIVNNAARDLIAAQAARAL